MTSVTKPENQKTHDYQMDNIRFLLIVAVVFGHMLELCSLDVARTLYRVVYSFHIPAFLFIAGYFARFDPKKILRSLFIPYLVFQTLYWVWEYHLFLGWDTVEFQYTTPYWLLWFILALLYYNLMIPLIQTKKMRTAAMITVFFVILGLAAGFDNTIEYYMTLSRALVFLPFFAAGHYSAAFGLKERISGHKPLVAAAFGAVILLCEYLFHHFGVEAKALFGAMSYETVGSSVWVRGLFYVCAISWVIFLLAVIPEIRIPVITGIGQRTLPVFLLHGFVLKYFYLINREQDALFENIPLSLLIALGLVVVFSLKPVNMIFKKLF